MKFLFLLYFLSCTTTKVDEIKNEISVVSAEDKRKEFPGELSVSGDEEYLKKIKALCSSMNELNGEEILEKSLGCLYSGKLRKSYFLYKSQLPKYTNNKVKKSMMLNNMGVIQMNWGHRDLAESLFVDSIEEDKNIVNIFNLLKLQAEVGSFTDESLVTFIENASYKGADFDILKAKLAVVFKKYETAIQNYDYAAEDEAEIMNFLYLLTKLKSEKKFIDVVSKFESKISANPNLVLLKGIINP